jgi:PPOX class probable F420-dependent enzyme
VSTDALWELVTGTRNGVLATIGEDGIPHQSNIYYLVDRAQRVVRFSTTTDRMKGRNLLRRATASLHVSGTNFLSYAVVAGPVSLLTPSATEDEAIYRLFDIHEALGVRPEWDGFGEKMLAENRLAVELTVQRIYGQIINREPRRW